MGKIIIASNNQGKISEFNSIFKDDEVLSLKDIGYNEEIEETGTTFLQNSLIKARTISNYLKQKGIYAAVLADDSGLCVNVLNGEPGVYSARYCGDSHNVFKNRQKLLDNLKGKKDRSAYFCCVMVKYFPDATYIYAEGKSQGYILEQADGESGFAYDPLFFSTEINKGFGHATMQEKNSVSHRGKATELLKQKEKFLKDNLIKDTLIFDN